MNRTLLSILASLVFAVSVRAQSVTGPQSAAPAPAAALDAVSIEEAQALKTMLPTSGELPLIVPTLLSLDVNSPEQRALLAPLKAAQAAGKISLPDVLAAAAQAVSTQRKAAMDAAAGQDATLAQVEGAVADLGRLRRLVALYEPQAGLELESALLNAEKRAAGLRAATVNASAEQTASALNQPRQDGQIAAAPIDGRVAVAQALIREMRDSAETDYSEGLSDKLQSMALETSAGEFLQRTIVEGFVADLSASLDTDYSEHLVHALEKIAGVTPFSTVKTAVVDGLMKDVHASIDTDYSNYGQSAVERIAIAASDNNVKGLAVAHMLKEIKDSADTEYSEETRARIDRIADSAGGLANIPVPEVPEPPKPAPAAPRPQASFLRQMSDGATDHPDGAFFGLIPAVLTAVSLAAHSYPVVGIAAALGLLLFVGVKGLWTNHPVAGFFQILAIGFFLANAATFGGTTSALGDIAMLANAALGAGLAYWSFRKDRPELGFFLNLVLMAAPLLYLWLR